MRQTSIEPPSDANDMPAASQVMLPASVSIGPPELCSIVDPASGAMSMGAGLGLLTLGGAVTLRRGRGAHAR